MVRCIMSHQEPPPPTIHFDLVKNPRTASLSAPFCFRYTPVGQPMSALPPKADIVGRHGDVRFVPKADIWHYSKFGEDSAPCGRKQAAWKRGHDPTNNARDERDQCVAASASGNFDAIS